MQSTGRFARRRSCVRKIYLGGRSSYSPRWFPGSTRTCVPCRLRRCHHVPALRGKGYNTCLPPTPSKYAHAHHRPTCPRAAAIRIFFFFFIDLYYTRRRRHSYPSPLGRSARESAACRRTRTVVPRFRAAVRSRCGLRFGRGCSLRFGRGCSSRFGRGCSGPMQYGGDTTRNVELYSALCPACCAYVRVAFFSPRTLVLRLWYTVNSFFFPLNLL